MVGKNKAINSRRLHVRKDGQPVSVKQVWWAVKTFSGTLTCAGAQGMEDIYHIESAAVPEIASDRRNSNPPARVEIMV